MSGPSVGVVVAARHAAQATRTMSASTERPRPRVPSITRSRTGRTAASGSIHAQRSRRSGSARRPSPIGRPSGWRVAPRRSRPRGVVARPRARRVAGRGDGEPESGPGGECELDARAAGASPRVQVVRAASSRVHVRAASQAAATANRKAGYAARAETIANWTPEQLARRPASKSSARRRRASTCAPRRRQRRRRTGWRARRRERRSAWRPEKPTRRAASGSGRMPRRTISERPSGGTAATGPGSRPSSARATAISAKISRWARTTCLPHDARVTTAREHVDDSTSPRSPP